MSKINISLTLMEAMGKLPPAISKKVKTSLEKFAADPSASGLNYEKVHAALDENIYSVRLDQNYRFILAREGDAHLFLWVDAHDDAYAWARRNRCMVNAHTGTMQLMQVEEVSKAEPTSLSAAGSPFVHLSDRELLSLGVPDWMLEVTRSVSGEKALNGLRPNYPQDAFEALAWVGMGFSVQDAIQEVYGSQQPELGLNGESPFEAALSRPASQRSFVLVQDYEELRAMLDAPLDRWRVFLHPSQRQYAYGDRSGPFLLTGGAGTGKTVVAMHRAKWLAEHSAPGEKILVTTYTQNLARDIEENLKKICSEREIMKIEVVNIDRWNNKFLQSRNHPYKVVYGEDLSAVWEEAVERVRTLDEGALFDLNFYQEEWSKVVLEHEAMTEEKYLKAPRDGRGARLGSRQRAAVWRVLKTYMEVCEEKLVKDAEALMRDCCLLLEEQTRMEGKRPLYAAVVVDEAQDLNTQSFRLVRALAGPERLNDIFIAGDSHQRIYGNKAYLSRCGINVRGRVESLRINYRTTEEVRSWAFRILKGHEFDNLDGGVEDGGPCRSLTSGPSPVVRQFSSLDEEAQYLIDEVRKLEEEGCPPRNICVVARTNKLVSSYIKHFLDAGIRHYEVKTATSDNEFNDGVRLATMHRVKGLEFDHVFVAAVNHGVVPRRGVSQLEDEAKIREALVAERCLLYVALTRAKHSASISCHGRISEFISTIQDGLDS